ncbi:MarR family winged helix-turn-helix transcriptional regulator [Actinospica sp.]|jgi:DNA-binding MarR family transcriptional regulator|uniref:MarR family winged helix-turn-helix transcriptional regulator n=1 Tax=Actinospica sp. TaxID=1872142 RepID=UPI002C466294|nr:MarR family transcriptional regulator [Actinospica sp.]HWG26031.1 MarR family transcriptional regulator [Actinospica sp.]
MTSEFDAELIAQVRRGASRLARRLRLERPADSMPGSRLTVLAHLRRWGPATPGELAASERLQPQSLTRVIADLEAEELLTRRRDERDRRQYVLEITDAGRFALARDMETRDEWLARAMRDLTETERQVLYLAGGLMDRLSGLGMSAHQVLRVADEGGAEREELGLGEQHDDQAE